MPGSKELEDPLLSCLAQSRTRRRSEGNWILRTSSFPSRGGPYRSGSIRKQDIIAQLQKLQAKVEEPVNQEAETSIWEEVKEQLSIALPMICVNLLQFSILFVSLLFVGHQGELELASASLANSIACVVGIYIMLGMASALETLCGQAYGAEEYHMLGVHLQRAVVTQCIACVPLSCIFLYMEQLLLLLGQSTRISAKAGEYAFWLVPALFANAFLQPLVKFLQTQSIVLPMVVGSGATLAVHVCLCWISIFKLGFGFTGAAISTSISFWVNVASLLLYMKVSNVCKDTWKGISKDAVYDLKGFLKLAAPTAFMICLEDWCFEVLVMLSGLLPNPELELSALSICLNTVTLNYMIPYGLSAAARVSNPRDEPEAYTIADWNKGTKGWQYASAQRPKKPTKYLIMQVPWKTKG